VGSQQNLLAGLLKSFTFRRLWQLARFAPVWALVRFCNSPNGNAAQQPYLVDTVEPLSKLWLSRSLATVSWHALCFLRRQVVSEAD